MTEIKSVQFGAPRCGRERKRERTKGERRDHTASRHFLPDDRATDGRTGWERLTAKCLLHPAAAA